VKRGALVADCGVDDDRVTHHEVRHQATRTTNRNELPSAQCDDFIEQAAGQRGSNSGMNNGKAFSMMLYLENAVWAVFPDQGIDQARIVSRSNLVDEFTEEAEHHAGGHVDAIRDPVAGFDELRRVQIILKQWKFHSDPKRRWRARRTGSQKVVAANGRTLKRYP
jgi:hypothetical protein